MKIKEDLAKIASKERAEKSKRFFKTGPGQYGEGDVFMGIRMPDLRNAIKNHLTLPLHDLEILLKDEIHEYRMAALLILVHQYKKTKDFKLVDFYLKQVIHINNWDLVDSSAHEIIGPNIGDYSILDNLLASKHLWSERIAMVATWHTNRKKNAAPTLYIAAKLLDHRHDLMHKAVGWMLREGWKHQPEAVEDFLFDHAAKIHATAMRYACEKMPLDKRHYFYGLRRAKA